MARHALGRSAVAALLLCSALVSRADAAWDLYEFYEDEDCTSFDYRSFLDTAAAPPCTPLDCTATGTGTYFRVTCGLADVTDLADGAVVKTLYSQADDDCAAAPTEIEQWPLNNCVWYGSFGYRKLFCDNGVVREYYCNTENCDDCLFSDITEGECLPGDFGISPRRFECHAEETFVCPGASFTQEADGLIAWQVGGNALDEPASVSPGKDCLAISLDGTVQGGWTVIYDSDEVRLRANSSMGQPDRCQAD